MNYLNVIGHVNEYLNLIGPVNEYLNLIGLDNEHLTVNLPCYSSYDVTLIRVCLHFSKKEKIIGHVTSLHHYLLLEPLGRPLTFLINSLRRHLNFFIESCSKNSCDNLEKFRSHYKQ